MTKQLGKIKEVDLREIFKNEASDFTPWLEKNIDQLNEALGIEIQDIKRENGVGDFSADLFGTEVNSEDKVIIENQLGSTDHDHLGKIITYASGVDAKYVVWISKKIRDEHKNALNWMNQMVMTGAQSTSAVFFFGVEVKAISIDNSPPALSFNLVVEPNSWEREIKSSVEKIDERHQKYLQIFTRLVAEYEKIKPDWGHLTAKPSSWVAFGGGKTGFRLVWAFRGDNKFNTELYIDTKDKDEIKMYFNELKKHQKEIEREIPDLSWEELPDRRASRIALYYKMPANIKTLNENQINDLIQWAIEKMDLFKKVITPYVKNLE